MSECPNCGHTWTDKRMSEGGKKSRRTITPEQQKKMQRARLAKKQVEGGA